MEVRRYRDLEASDGRSDVEVWRYGAPKARWRDATGELRWKYGSIEAWRPGGLKTRCKCSDVEVWSSSGHCRRADVKVWRRDRGVHMDGGVEL